MEQSSMQNSDNQARLDHCLALLKRIDGLWMQTFPEIRHDALAYRQLFLGLYENRGRDVSKGEAGDYLAVAEVRSPQKKAKLISDAIKMGLIQEEIYRGDNRVILVRMTQELAPKIQVYLSQVLRLLEEAVLPDIP
jgi:hypothetical protein